MLKNAALAYPKMNMILAALGSLVVLGQMIVVVTPSKKDDEKLAEIKKGMLGSILDLLSRFAVIQKK